ncbi:AfsR/SARP family transcriptional regulator [Actinoplanes sp. CA-030573]|uniref:AfsR/SARP family transcriptional regulator n=1 Tax=Actinoplanes sp. CA-030573 TaxID=3239898 RepID=UPI003D8E9797
MAFVHDHVVSEKPGIGLSVGVLGSLVVAADGVEQAPGGPAPRLLLHRLVIAGGRMVPIGELVTDIWGYDPPSSAVGSLQTYVSRLRKVFEPATTARTDWQVLVRQGPGYALRLPPGSVDADRFATLAGEGADHLAAGDAEAARAVLDRALALWRGPAYADCAEHDFARPEARRLDELRVVATENRLAALLELGDRHVVAALEAFTEAHPLHERGWALLAQARYRWGRQGDALDALRSARRHITEELGIDLGPELIALQSAILAQDPALSAPARRPVVIVDPAPAGDAFDGGLPVRLSSLVGRDGDVRTVAGLLDRHRLVTLTGTGGIGKTRLALEVARLRAGEDVRAGEDGPWLVELAGLHDPTLLAATVAKMIGTAASTTEALAAALRHRRTLLILDNCEHLVDAVAPLVEQLLGAAPGLRVLATSREMLDAEAECPYEVPPLSAGQDGDAVRLFLDRAAMVAPGWSPGPADRAVLAEICAGLDGMPLAIELAAAQCNTLSIGQISELLNDRFTLLRRGRRANSRHATMLAAVEWSYDMLTADEQEVFQALAVFEEGFVLDAAQVVSGRRDVLIHLTSLVAKSLVTVVGGDPRRYRMLETLRDFALLRTDPARHRELIERHVAWVGSLSDLSHATMLEVDLSTRLSQESANVRAALERATDPAVLLRIAAGFYWFWYRQGLVAEGLRHLEPAVAYWDGDRPGQRPDDATMARASIGLALLYYLGGKLDRIGAALARAVEHAGRGIEPTTEAQVLATVSYFEARSAQTAAARVHADLALRRARELRRVDLEAEVLMVFGEIERQDGNFDEAAVRLRESAAGAVRSGYTWVSSSAQWIHAKVEIARDRYADAQPLASATVAESYAASDISSWLVGIATLSHIRHRQGRLDEAAELAGMVAWHGSRVGYSPYDMDPELADYLHQLRAAMPAGDYETAAARSRALSRSATMARVREMLGS